MFIIYVGSMFACACVVLIKLTLILTFSVPLLCFIFFLYCFCQIKEVCGEGDALQTTLSTSFPQFTNNVLNSFKNCYSVYSIFSFVLFHSICCIILPLFFPPTLLAAHPPDGGHAVAPRRARAPSALPRAVRRRLAGCWLFRGGR
jgi:hypothetical protein